MGLSNFPSAAEGVLPVLVMNTVLSVALLKNIIRSLLQVVGASSGSSNPSSSFDDYDEDSDNNNNIARKRRVSITQFKSLCQSRSSTYEASPSSSFSSSSSTAAAEASGIARSCSGSVECCVCLCGFEADEEVSELSCKHFFHKGCLDVWFHNKHTTCPLCRSIH